MKNRFLLNYLTPLIVLATGLSVCMAQSSPPPAPPGPAANAAPAPAAKLPQEEVEKLVAPIALYPDVLLAQMLPAATFPMDVVMAARWLRTKPDISKVLNQPWDPSVLSLCHYPEALYKLDADLEWTNALGATFLDQQQDVMNAIQDLRAQAKTAGALQTNPQQTVVVEEQAIRIVPSEAQVVYVPQYDPQVVYATQYSSGGVSTAGAVAASAISFTAGLALGAWLDNDCDWHGHGVYYCKPGYWGGYGGIHGHTAVAWGNDWAAAVGPRRAAVAGPNGGAYVGPHGAAVWGDNGRGAAWSRGSAVARPTYGGRYSNYGTAGNRATQVNRGSNNQINVNQNNVNIDRGNNTNINNSGNINKVNGGNNNTNVNRGNTANAKPTPYSSSHNASDTKNMSNRGQQSRASNSAGASNASQQPRSTGASQQPRSGGASQRDNGGGGQRSNAFSGSGGSARQTQQSSSRGSASRGGSRGGGGGGGGRR